MTLLLLALAGLAAWVFSLYFWPFAPCRRCEGSGKNAGSNGKRFGDCGRCGGSGRRQRLGSKTVHRTVRGRIDYRCRNR